MKLYKVQPYHVSASLSKLHINHMMLQNYDTCMNIWKWLDMYKESHNNVSCEP